MDISGAKAYLRGSARPMFLKCCSLDRSHADPCTTSSRKIHNSRLSVEQTLEKFLVWQTPSPSFIYQGCEGTVQGSVDKAVRMPINENGSEGIINHHGLETSSSQTVR